MILNGNGGKGKKVTSIILTGAILVGTIGGGILAKNLAGRNKETPEKPTTSVTQVNDELLQQLSLTADFDINDHNTVMARAIAIYTILSEKEFAVDVIANLIYLVNGKYESIDFSAKIEGLEKGEDKELYRAKYVNRLFLVMAELLNDNIVDCVNKQSYLYGNASTDIEPKYDSLIYSYMFMASGQTDNSLYTVSKQDAIELAKIVRKQLNNIRDGKADVLATTAGEYYNHVSGLLNKTGKVENSENIVGYTYIFFRETTGKNTLFTHFLTEEQAAELDKNNAENYNSILEGKIYENLNISKDTLIKAGIEAGKFGNDVPEYGEKNNKKDAKIANNSPEAKKEKANDMIDAGGKPVGNSGGSSSSGSGSAGSSSNGKQEQINEPTTKTEEDTSIAQPGGGGSHEEVEEPGGDVVSEVEVDNIYDYGNVGGNTYSDGDLANTKTK